MNGRLRKASALFASLAVLSAGVLVTLAPPASAAAPCQSGCSLGTTGVGANGGSNNYNDANQYEIGVQFHVTAPGIVNQIKFFVSADESDEGNHIARLWRVSGAGGPAGQMTSQLGPVSGGVNTFAITPQAVVPGDVYIASYGVADGLGYNGPPSGLPTVSGSLVGDAGIFANGQGVQPSITAGNSYGIDLNFVAAPAGPTITSTTTLTPSSTSVAFSDAPVSGTTYKVTCTPVAPAIGATVTTASSASTPITVTGLTNDIPYRCTVTATNAAGSTTGPPSAIFVAPSTSGPGCAGTVTAPEKLSAASMAFPGAVVSWAPVDADPASCLVGYLVTPTTGSTAGTPTFVLGHGTTTHVKPLVLGSSYTFTVAAVTGSGVGPASAPVGPVTIGTPAAVSAVTAKRVAKGAIKVAFTAGRNNGAAITKFTAACKTFAGGVKTASGKSGPLVVKGLKPGRSYICAVSATNSRGRGAAARSNAATA